MRQSSTLLSGMDVPKDAIAVASVAQDHGAEVMYLGPIGTRQWALEHLIRKMPSQATHLIFIDEAGPCGDGLSRYLTQQGDDCWGVAPALIPQTPGDRVNTDRRDAGQRARLARSGDLTAVDVPTVAEETISALTDAPYRLHAFWRRHDIRDTGRAQWGPAHRRWLSEVVCPTPAPHIVFPDDVRAVSDPSARLQRLDQARREHVTAWRVSPVGEALQALRGVQGLAAVTRVADLGDLPRLERPRARTQWMGLSPAASSSGAQRRQGALTTAGHTHA